MNHISLSFLHALEVQVLHKLQGRGTRPEVGAWRAALDVFRFCEYFLERPDWRVYPNQKWFEDEKGNEYHCPLGKKLVDFADESHFSRIAMYLKGRAWLEEKTKVLELAPGKMPDTYIIENGQWRGSPPHGMKRSLTCPGL